MINALIECLEDTSNELIHRGALDFLITHMKLSENIISEAEKVKLLYYALPLLTKKNNDITLRKFYLWAIGPSIEESVVGFEHKDNKSSEYKEDMK